MGVRGQAFFTGQTSRGWGRCEECLTGHPTASAFKNESPGQRRRPPRSFSGGAVSSRFLS